MAVNTKNTSRIIYEGKDNTRKAVKSAKGGFSSLTKSVLRATSGIISAYAAINATKALVRGANELQNMENRLRLVAGAAGDVESIQQRLFDVALRTRQPVKDLAETYARLGLAAEASGIPLAALESVVETIGQASAISGASAQESANAIRQFTQGFQSGRFAGEELRAVLEQLPRLATLIAEGMGVSVGQLRELGKTGKLTTQQLYEAIKKGRVGVQVEFDSMNATIDQASTNIKTALLRIEDAWLVNTGLAQSYADALNDVADGLNDIVEIGLAAKTFEQASDAVSWSVENVLGTVAGMVGHPGLADALKWAADQMRDNTQEIIEEYKVGLQGVVSGASRSVAGKVSDDLKKKVDPLPVIGGDIDGGDFDSPDALKYAQQGEKLRREEAARRRAAAAEQAEADLINFQESMEREVAFAEERKQILEDLGLGPESEMEKLRLRHEEEQQLLESRLGWTAEYADLELALLARQKGEVVALEQKSAAKQRATRAKLYNDLLGFAAVFGKKGQKIMRAITAVQKGEAFVQSLLSIQTGASNALATQPFPANLVAAAAVIAKGAAFIGAIKSVGGGGGGGGSISAGSSFTPSTGLSRPLTAAVEEPQRREIDITLKSYRGPITLDREGLRSLAQDIIEEAGGGRDFITARVHIDGNN